MRLLPAGSAALLAEVGTDQVPAAKWAGYDPERRHLARAFARPVADGGEQGTLGF